MMKKTRRKICDVLWVNGVASHSRFRCHAPFEVFLKRKLSREFLRHFFLSEKWKVWKNLAVNRSMIMMKKKVFILINLSSVWKKRLFFLFSLIVGKRKYYFLRFQFEESVNWKNDAKNCNTILKVDTIRINFSLHSTLYGNENYHFSIRLKLQNFIKSLSQINFLILFNRQQRSFLHFGDWGFGFNRLLNHCTFMWKASSSQHLKTLLATCILGLLTHIWNTLLLLENTRSWRMFYNFNLSSE